MSGAPLAFGGASIGNLYTAMDDDQATDVVDAAWAGGIRDFDTAPHYGLGESERRLGAALHKRNRDEYTISTKVGRLLVPRAHGAARDTSGFDVESDFERQWDLSASGLRSSVEQSLVRMGMDRVDTIYLHDPEEYTSGDEWQSALGYLAAMRDEGLVANVGVGSKSVAPLLAAVRSGLVDRVMVAGRLTLMAHSAALELVPACLEQGVDIVNVGVYNSGLLATPWPAEGARFDYEPASAAVLERARSIATVCGEYNTDLPTVALRYAARQPAVRSVVVGAASASEVSENVERMRAEIPDQLWAVLAERGLID